MPPNNLRAFDDGLDGIENQDKDSIDENSSSDEQESILSSKADKSNNTDEKTTDDSESSESTSSGDLSFESDDNNGKPAKWIAAIAAATTYAYLMEKHRQKRLTKVPLVMGQIPKSSRMESILDQLTNGDGILSKPIVPSLFVGTRGQLASSVAFLNPGSKSELRFSEVLASSYDGAEILLDWEIPQTATFNTRKNAILRGNISNPTVLILHGINNSSDYGYIKSLQTTMTNRGWNAVAMSFRGAARGGRQPMTTPRSYTAAYTGDLRSVVRQLVSRMVPNNNGSTSHCPLFLVGNSLGGLLVTKYLGEEGLAGTLPENVLGGISLGNPFSFRSNRARFPFGIAIGGARKFNYFCQRKAMSMNRNESSSPTSNVHKDPRKISLASLDKALAPTMVRTSLHPPFETKIGYGHTKNGDNTVPRTTSALSPEEEYWADSSCYKQGRHVSVPILHVMARDDTLCYPSARSFLGYSLQNPNAIVVQTRTGGHLGWWHKPNKKSKSDSWWGLDSWADGATADFIQAVMDTQKGIAPTPVAAIDDAHNVFTKKVIGSDASDTSRFVSETISTRPLSGDRDGNSTIATSDHSSHEEIRKGPQTPISDNKPSKTYFKFQQILLSRNQWEEEQQVLSLERNRFLERRESQESLRLLRSRL